MEQAQRITKWARDVCHPENVGAATQHAKQTILSHPREFLYGLLIFATVGWISAIAIRHFKSKHSAPIRPGTPDLEKPPASPVTGQTKNKYVMQEPGVWAPSQFKRPAAEPFQDWSVTGTKPLPYRPFRPKYYVTMGLRNMDWNEWIELDNDYMKYHKSKADRIAERGKKCSYTSPEVLDSAIELLEEFCDYLPQRYPTMFKKTEVGMDNIVTNESFNIVERPLKEDPMAMAARMVQDDLALMFEKEDGQYYLLAGSILLAGFWRLEDKFGMPLSEIHTSADVPQYREKLEKGMMNFFRRLRPEAPMVRNNYFIQVDDNLAWSHSIGSEDDTEGNISWNTAQKNKAIEHHHFRSERQSLRRLPRTGAVLFTIRTYFVPMTEICKEPFVPGRLGNAVRSWADDVSRYRGRERFEEVLLEYLDNQHEQQVASGLPVEKEEDLYKYPF